MISDPALLALIGPWLVGLVLAGLFAAFALEWRPPEVSAMTAVAILILAGVVTLEDVLGAFTNSAPATIAAMFIISAALVRTGALAALAQMLTKPAKSHPQITVVLFLLVTMVLSGFMNNTPLVMLMIPIAVTMSLEMKSSSSKLLIPLSYAAIVGGTTTLIGTSTNILVDGVAQSAGLAPFGMFEVAPLGVASGAVALVYLILMRGVLPDRAPHADATVKPSAARFMVEAAIEDGSQFVGRRPRDIPQFKGGDRTLVDVVRGDASLRRDIANVTLEAGDIVVLRTTVKDILEMKERGDVIPGLDPDPDLQKLGARASSLVEVLLGPGSRMIGRTLRDLRLRRRYGVYAIAVHRRGVNLAERLETAPLMVGDTVLVEGDPKDIDKLVDDMELVSVTPRTVRPFRKGKAPIALAALAGVVVAAAGGLLPIAGAALVAAAVVLLTRCVEPDEAFAAVDWRVLTLIAAMLVIGAALDKTALVPALVGPLTPWLAAAPPILALALVYVLCSALTEVVTNNAVAIIMTPVAITVAQSLGLDPRPFVVAVMFAASASFLTPIGYQTNTLVYSAGGYRFTDFLRVGAGMNILMATVSLTLIPMIWPLAPA